MDEDTKTAILWFIIIVMPITVLFIIFLSDDQHFVQSYQLWKHVVKPIVSFVLACSTVILTGIFLGIIGAMVLPT